MCIYHVPSSVICTHPPCFSEATRPQSVDAAVLWTVYEAHTVQHAPSHDHVSTDCDALHPAADRDRWRLWSHHVTISTIHAKHLVKVGTTLQYSELNDFIERYCMVFCSVNHN